MLECVVETIEKVVEMRQFIVNEEGKRTAVVLPIEEYEELLELAEDAEALKEADEALGELERGEEDPLPLDKAIREIEEESRKIEETKDPRER